MRQGKRIGAAVTLALASVMYCACAWGQATPTASSPLGKYVPGANLPLINGNYSYSLTASDIAEFGDTGLTSTAGASSDINTVALSGTVEYISQSKTKPFSAFYTGGLLLSNYQGQGTGFFQDFTVSQGLQFGRWGLGVSDTFSYLPESPTLGLSGVAGVGDLGLQPLPVGGPPAQSVLTNYAEQISNYVTGNIQRELTGKTTVNATAGYGILVFTQSNGLNSNEVMGEVGLNRRIDARDNVGVNASYSTFTFPGMGTSFDVRSANLEFDRMWTRSLSTQISAGPQLQSGFNSVPITTPYFDVVRHGELKPRATPALTVPVPSQLNLGVMAGLTYTHHHTAATVSYMRGVNGGSGVEAGAFADDVMGSLTRNFGRVWTASVFMSYVRTSGFQGFPPTTAEIGGTQLSRELGRNFSIYASYTAVNQTIASVLAAQNAYGGLYHAVAAGITFSPRAFHVRQY